MASLFIFLNNRKIHFKFYNSKIDNTFKILKSEEEHCWREQKEGRPRGKRWKNNISNNNVGEPNFRVHLRF